MMYHKSPKTLTNYHVIFYTLSVKYCMIICQRSARTLNFCKNYKLAMCKVVYAMGCCDVSVIVVLWCLLLQHYEARRSCAARLALLASAAATALARQQAREPQPRLDTQVLYHFRNKLA